MVSDGEKHFILFLVAVAVVMVFSVPLIYESLGRDPIIDPFFIPLWDEKEISPVVEMWENNYFREQHKAQIKR